MSSGIITTPAIMNDFRQINDVVDKGCKLACTQPLLVKQLFLLTDAIFQAAGYAVMTEDDPNQKSTSTCKTYAPVAYGSKTFIPSQTNKNFAVGQEIVRNLFLI